MRTLFLCVGVAVLVAFICGCGMEELREMCQTTYEKAIAALDKVITENSE